MESPEGSRSKHTVNRSRAIVPVATEVLRVKDTATAKPSALGGNSISSQVTHQVFKDSKKCASRGPFFQKLGGICALSHRGFLEPREQEIPRRQVASGGPCWRGKVGLGRWESSKKDQTQVHLIWENTARHWTEFWVCAQVVRTRLDS